MLATQQKPTWASQIYRRLAAETGARRQLGILRSSSEEEDEKKKWTGEALQTREILLEAWAKFHQKAKVHSAWKNPNETFQTITFNQKVSNNL